MKYLFHILLIFPAVTLQSQAGMNHSARWIDSLQFHLRLDRPLISDSILSINYLGKTVIFHINAERPDIDHSLDYIDSLVYHDSNDTTLSRLISLLHLFDARYLSEFAFRQDYFIDIYHKIPYVTNSNQKNELDIIEYLENAVILKRLLKNDSAFIVNVLIGKDTTYYSNKTIYESRTFKIFGRVNWSFFRQFYQAHEKMYESFLIDATKDQLTRHQAYNIIHSLGMFNKIPPDPADCEKLNKYIDRNTSKELLSVMLEYAQRWPGQECLQELLKTVISD